MIILVEACTVYSLILIHNNVNLVINFAKLVLGQLKKIVNNAKITYINIFMLL